MRSIKGGEIRRCPNCGKAYRVYNMTCVDQSLCPICREKLEREADETERCTYRPRFSK